MGIPADLRPFMSGKREIKHSLGLKDREAAKAEIPDMTKAAHALLDKAKRDKADAAKPAPKPVAPRSAAQIERDRQRWEGEQEQIDLASDASFAADMEHEALGPVMDAMAAGIEVDASPADLVRAGQLAILDEREKAGAEREALLFSMLPKKVKDARAKLSDVLVAGIHSRYGPNAHASKGQNQAVEYRPATGSGKGLYLDTNILDGWAAERKPSPKAKDSYWRDAKLFNSLIGRKSVELITKADVMNYKRLLIADPKRSQVNVRDRLAYLRTLLEWAAQEDITDGNVARDVKMAVSERSEKRKDFNTDDLNALFSGPIYTKGDRPKAGFGEAAYWLPLIALFMGARREEIGQLRVGDVKRVPYIDDNEVRQEVWCIEITDTPDGDALPNQVKNESSNRVVPLHPKLIELGFIDYVTKLPNQAGRVFPDLKAIGIGKKLTDKWGQWFTNYKRACGIDDKAKVFHSFRHTWKTHAVDAGIAERICRQFQGHEGKDAADKYGATPSMRVLVAAMATYRVPGLEIGKPTS
jgi:integrase